MRGYYVQNIKYIGLGDVDWIDLAQEGKKQVEN
jgi:hypothetical protein